MVGNACGPGGGTGMRDSSSQSASMVLDLGSSAPRFTQGSFPPSFGCISICGCCRWNERLKDDQVLPVQKKGEIGHRSARARDCGEAITGQACSYRCKAGIKSALDVSNINNHKYSLVVVLRWIGIRSWMELSDVFAVVVEQRRTEVPWITWHCDR